MDSIEKKAHLEKLVSLLKVEPDQKVEDARFQAFLTKMYRSVQEKRNSTAQQFVTMCRFRGTVEVL